MTPETFIRKHIIDHLVAEGFSVSVAGGGLTQALSITSACRSPARQGSAFDDCLAVALRWVKYRTPVTERKAAKRSISRQLGLL